MIAIGKNIIIETVEKEVKTESGLLLSAHDANDFRYKTGIVVVPGTDVSVIKSGDEIYYDKNNSYTMVINDKPYTIIHERDVVVVSGRSSAL
jgi:co-chaperonin GroES (HSP10)